MSKHILYLIGFSFLLFVNTSTNAQQKNEKGKIKVAGFITPKGDTIPETWLDPVEIKGKRSASQKKFLANWTRLRNAVYVTYPYALTAGVIINDVSAQLKGVTDPKKRRQIIKLREKELKRDFADKVTSLSVFQGKILMKLIHRETGDNCYEIIKEFKGGFNAGLWQTVAFLFGSNLKQPYDAKGEDKEIEKFVQEVRKLYGYRS
jgi:hypothetical protein